MEARDYEADYRQLIMQHEDLKDKYAHLNTKYKKKKSSMMSSLKSIVKLQKLQRIRQIYI